MLENNPIFTKENIKEVASILGNASYLLIYDGNDLEEQIEAGKKLRPAKYLVATIGDHIFDYFPYSYFCNDDDLIEYEATICSIIEFLGTAVLSMLDSVETSFPLIETITRDKLNQHRVPKRNIAEEEKVTTFLLEVLNNIDEIENRLRQPKKLSDPNKPTAESIREAISKIKFLQNDMLKFGEQHGMLADAMQYKHMFDQFLFPLYLGWQLYKYGWHSDFWKEGDSMFEYMSFEMNAAENIETLLSALKYQSPFSQFEVDYSYTDNLIPIYEHLLQGIKRGKLIIK